MDAVNTRQNYHDLGQLDELRSAAQKDPQKALKTVAQQFESMFMQMLLKQMRKSNEAFETDSPMNNRQTQTYRDMHDQQMAMELSQSGALGLADLIVSQLDPSGSNMTPASVLRGGTEPNLDERSKKFTLNEDLGTQAALSPSIAAAGSETLAKNSNKAVVIAVETDKALVSEPEASNTQRQSFATPSEFIDAILPLAEKWAAKRGIEPLTVVAQAALESGWGRKMIKNQDGSSSHNLFGIKADQRWQGSKTIVNTLEYRDGQALREKASFRSYGSFEDSVKDYLNFLDGPRYQQAVAHGRNSQRYTQELQKAGYATDPNYADKINSIVNGQHMAPYKQASSEEK